jgi:hypothetical protein
MQKKAIKVGTYIVKRLPSSKLKNGTDYNWAAENGFGESKIVAAIKARAGL